MRLTLVVPNVFLAAAMASAAQEATIVPGVPLRVVLEHRVAIHKVGDPLQGRLVEPVYVFDRMVLPAGTVVEGHIAEIGGVPAGRRIAATLSGNFTPRRDVRAQFDSLVLPDGTRLGFQAAPSLGAAHTARIATPQARAPQNGHEPGPAALAFRTPGKMRRLKSRLFAMLPYHRRSWEAGTLFASVLERPLAVPQTAPAPAGDAGVDARLVTPLNSATLRKGAPVEAIVTRPVFSPARALLIPEGSRLLGQVSEAQRARLFHRNGKLLFVFQKITLPSGEVKEMQGNLEGLDADLESHLSLDPEGAAHIAESPARFVFPAIAATAAGLSLHQDYNQQGVPDQDIGGRAEAGAVGLGLVGTAVAQASRALAMGIAFTGAGYSIYTTFLARGADVVLPANTPLRISLGPRGRP